MEIILKKMYATEESTGYEMDTALLASDLDIIEQNTNSIVNEASTGFENKNYSGTNEENVNALVSKINEELGNMQSPLQEISSIINEIRDAYELRITEVGNINAQSGSETYVGNGNTINMQQ